MKKLSVIFILLNLALVLGFFGYKVYDKERTLKQGELVLLRLAPVDPRSLIQGDYMSLRYAIFDDLQFNPYQKADVGYIVVKVDDNAVGEFVRYIELGGDMSVDDGELLIECRVKKYGQVRLGAESYFFEEGQADYFAEAEYGGLRVDKSGKSVLVGLYDENYELIVAPEGDDLHDYPADMEIDAPDLIFESTVEDSVIVDSSLVNEIVAE